MMLHLLLENLFWIHILQMYLNYQLEMSIHLLLLRMESYTFGVLLG